ncbi:MAG: DUF4097 family beta strand repeat protein [Clostridia bacterium]|nr:DUF4097 family beta strand repeat protein [Clostridia bacterium]
MTREQFLNELKAALAGLKEEELEGVLAYYAEMIDDRMEAGMTEEAAIKAMEPVSVIAGRVLEEAGVAETREKPRDKGNWQEIRRPAEASKEVRIQAEGKRVRVIAQEDCNEIVLRYCIGSADIFRLHEDESALVLEHKLRPVSSFANEKSPEGFSLDTILNSMGKLLSSLGGRIVSGVSYEAPENEIEVTLPKTYCGELNVSTSNARISLEGLTATQPIKLTTSNARITADDVNCAGQVVCTTSNSRIALGDVNAHALRLITSNGRVELDDVLARDGVEAVNSNGGIKLTDCEIGGALHAATSNGAIELDDSSCGDITLKTSNGVIGGILKGKREEYTVSSSTSNANNLLGNFSGGEKQLRAVTSNAPITLKFAE